MWKKILFVVFVLQCYIVQSQFYNKRCNSADISLHIRRKRWDRVAKYALDDSYKFINPAKECLFHFYSRSEIAYCLQNKHFVLTGGSSGQALALRFLQKFIKVELPFKLDENNNCISNCEPPYKVKGYDIVIDKNGDVLSYFELEGRVIDYDTLEIGDLDEKWSEVFQKAHDRVEGSFRFTHFPGTYYFDDSARLIEHFQPVFQSPPNSVVLFGYHISHWVGNPFRMDLKRADEDTRWNSVYPELMKETVEFLHNAPYVKHAVLFPLQYKSKFVNPVQKVIDSLGKPQKVFVPRKAITFDTDIKDYKHAAHPTNHLYEIIIAWYLNSLCENPKISLRRDETITFDSPTCSVLDESELYSWYNAPRWTCDSTVRIRKEDGTSEIVKIAVGENYEDGDGSGDDVNIADEDNPENGGTILLDFQPDMLNVWPNIQYLEPTLSESIVSDTTMYRYILAMVSFFIVVGIYLYSIRKLKVSKGDCKTKKKTNSVLKERSGSIASVKFDTVAIELADSSSGDTSADTSGNVDSFAIVHSDYFDNQPAEVTKNETQIPLAKTISVMADSNSTTGPSTKKKKRLNAFGMMRFVASVHIVAGHLVRLPNDVITQWYTNDFGYTWVPWFMMLSGFILSYAQLSRSNPEKMEKWYIFTAKRVKSIYPLYLVSLFCSALLDQVLSDRATFLGSPLRACSSIFLLQAWIPSVTEHVYQTHCWFLSCIIPYWMLHGATYRFFNRRSTKTIVIVAVLLMILPWVGLVIIPKYGFGNLYWYHGHKYGRYKDTIDTLVIMAKFHPLFYWHTYLFGILLALIYDRTKKNPPFIFRWGTVIGYVGLFTIFIQFPYTLFPGASKLSCRLGVLFPFQGLLLIGAALNKDPIARFFSSPYFLPLGDWSYPQYLFQFIALKVWGYKVDTNFGYWCVLLALSVVGFHLVQKPTRPWGRVTKKKYAYSLLWSIIIPCTLALLVFIRDYGYTFPTPRLPAAHSHSNTTIDARIGIRSFLKQHNVLFPPLQDVSPNDVYYTNPSILWDDELNQFVFALRRHRFLESETNALLVWNDVLIEKLQNKTWNSDIVFGLMQWDDLSTQPNVTFAQVLQVDEFDSDDFGCDYKIDASVNGTMSTLARHGPEDPRLYLSPDGEYHLTFNRVPKTLDCQTESRMFKVPLFNSLELQELSDSFYETEHDQQTEMDKLYRPATMIEFFESHPSEKEKNWVQLTDGDDEFFIHQFNPFTVIEPLDDSLYYLTNRSQMIENTTTIHGGSTAIRMDNCTATLDPCYLGSFHMVNGDTYENRLVKMRHEYPFEPFSVSKKLELLIEPPLDGSVSEGISFLSGLSFRRDVEGTTLFVSYGSSNVDARVLVLDGDSLFED